MARKQIRPYVDPDTWESLKTFPTEGDTETFNRILGEYIEIKRRLSVYDSNPLVALGMVISSGPANSSDALPSSQKAAIESTADNFEDLVDDADNF